MRPNLNYLQLHACPTPTHFRCPLQRHLKSLLDMREMRLEMARLDTQRRLEQMRLAVERCVRRVDSARAVRLKAYTRSIGASM